MALAAATAEPGPAIRVVAPASQVCPDAGAIQRALGPLASPAGGPASPAWTLSTEPGAATLRLALREPGGRLALAREIATGDLDCGAVTDLVALVLERFFRDVAWTSDATSPAAARSLPPAPPATAAVVSPAPVPVPAGAAVARPPRLVLSLGPAWWSRASAPVSVVVEARARVAGPASVALGLLLPGLHATQPVGGDGGQATLDTWPAAWLRIAAEAGRARLFYGASVDGFFTYERAATTGIAMTRDNDRVLVAAGLGLGGGWTLAPRWRISLDASVHRAVLGSSFVVDGRGTVLDPSAFQGLVTLRVGYVIAP